MLRCTSFSFRRGGVLACSRVSHVFRTVGSNVVRVPQARSRSCFLSCSAEETALFSPSRKKPVSVSPLGKPRSSLLFATRLPLAPPVCILLPCSPVAPCTADDRSVGADEEDSGAARGAATTSTATAAVALAVGFAAACSVGSFLGLWCCRSCVWSEAVTCEALEYYPPAAAVNLEGGAGRVRLRVRVLSYYEQFDAVQDFILFRASYREFRRVFVPFGAAESHKMHRAVFFP